MKNKLLDQFIDEKFIIQRHTLTHTHIHIELLEIDYGSCCKNGSRMDPGRNVYITYIPHNLLYLH